MREPVWGVLAAGVAPWTPQLQLLQFKPVHPRLWVSVAPTKRIPGQTPQRSVISMVLKAETLSLTPTSWDLKALDP